MFIIIFIDIYKRASFLWYFVTQYVFVRFLWEIFIEIQYKSNKRFDKVERALRAMFPRLGDPISPFPQQIVESKFTA